MKEKPNKIPTTLREMRTYAEARRKDAARDIQRLKRAVAALESGWKQTGMALAKGGKVPRRSMDKKVGAVQTAIKSAAFYIDSTLFWSEEAREREQEARESDTKKGE